MTAIVPSGGVRPASLAQRGDHRPGRHSRCPDRTAVGGEHPSSFRTGHDGTLHTVSASVPTQETAACWVELTADGRFAYVTNTGSGTISGFRIRAGQLLPLNPADGSTADVGDGTAPLDMAATEDFLYVLAGTQGRIDGFLVGNHGELTRVSSSAGGLPLYATGLAAF